MQEQEKANLDTQEESQEIKEANEVLEEQNDTKEALEAKIKELEEKYLRTYADFENTKKRLIREKDQSLEYAYEKFAKDLLTSIDTLEMALKSIKEAKEANEANEASEILGKIQEGISLTLDNLLKALAKNGVEPISVEGGFDPNFHDAIMQVPSEAHEDGQIVAELQKGYKYKERVLRPSMVSIAKN
ncbi:nucleotide exchange factor GrpE [Helicobacter burdigaliensis]|uniref:nucleotide exchange factor GrpE n=1 Tax=Helicobacter burdigaliensis TaxID=2315334 RepID=UPI000EF6C344|nr:nucleotide exchange factor GrpE [Helicobacter burdigaliensis]